MDNLPALRTVVADLLGETADMELIGHADNGQTAVERVMRQCPDVVLMDIGLPRLNGIAATRPIAS